MIWLKIVDHGKFFSGDAVTKECILPVQDLGMRVRDIVYGVELLDASASATLGLVHREGASDDPTFFMDPTNIITLASAGSPRKTLKGGISSATLLPYFQPSIQVGSASGIQWVVINVYVGGKPF